MGSTPLGRAPGKRGREGAVPSHGPDGKDRQIRISATVKLTCSLHCPVWKFYAVSHAMEGLMAGSPRPGATIRHQ